MTSCVTDLADPVALAQALIGIETVTPDQGKGIESIENWLNTLGFSCQRLDFGSGEDRVANLYASRGVRKGKSAPNLCFAGHSDVVPPGDENAWSLPPFAGEIRDGYLYGRGSADMKGGIACYIAAIAQLDQEGWTAPGCLSLLITGDEEGPAHNGTKPVLEALAAQGEKLDACITGEPTNPHHLGDAMKIGRRGSLNGEITVRGTQGHTGYPHLADNAAHRLVRACQALLDLHLDDGSAFFDPSTLAISSIDIGNPVTNIIPAMAKACFNIRFNDLHSGKTLEDLLRKTLKSIDESADPQAMQDGRISLSIRVSGESFLTEPGLLSQAIGDACHTIIGKTPELSTSGGTSDSRFIKAYCPVIDFGLVGRTMHQIDEAVAVENYHKLAEIYALSIKNFFAASQQVT